MEKINAEKLVAMLKSKGVTVTIDQATSIIKFLRKCAEVVVKDHLTKGDK